MRHSSKRMEILALLEMGLTPKEIIKKTGVSGCNISNLRKSLNIPQFKKGAPPGIENPNFKQKYREEARRLKILGWTYESIGSELGISRQRVQQYLRIPKRELQKHSACESCGITGTKLHGHHTDYTSNTFKALCVSCHRSSHKSKTVKTKTDKHGQVIAQDLLPLTPMEEAIRSVLEKEYRKAKGNISLTSRLVGWSRTKTLNMLKTHNLYHLFKHDPWPVERSN